ncbi:hypothetical protein [Caballeronia sp. Lep1P3]|nr:hypothetical protein [Caballeronia sp. Lep1P3]
MSSDELGQSMEAEMLSILTADQRRQLNSIIDKLAEEFCRSAKG